MNVAETHILALIAQLDQSGIIYWDAAVKELVSIGEPTLPYLLNALHSPSKRTRQGVVEALRLLQDARAIGPLLEMEEDPKRTLWDPEDYGASWVYEALERIGRTNFEELAKYIDHRGVPRTLGTTGDPRAIELLINKIRQAEPSEPIAYLLYALDIMDNPQTTQRLIELICDSQFENWQYVFEFILSKLNNAAFANILACAPSNRRKILQTLFDEHQTKHMN